MSCCIHTSIYEHSVCTMHKHDMSWRKDRINFYLDVPSNVFSQSNFNNYAFYGRRETYQGCLLFPLLVASIKQKLQGCKSKRNTWKEVASQVIKQTANRNNILLSCYFKLYYHDFLEPLSKYRMHPHFFCFCHLLHHL